MGVTKTAQSAIRHARNGTLKAEILRKTGRSRSRWDARTPNEAARALAHLIATSRLPAHPKTLLLTDDEHSEFFGQVRGQIDGAVQVMTDPSELASIEESFGIGMVAIVSLSSQSQLSFARTVMRSSLAEVPLEYIAIPTWEQRRFRGWDHHTDWEFVSPLLATQGCALEDIFGESLTLFEHKTEIRDYLDLAARLAELERRQVPGDIGEFGAYKGHSGWLISRTLELLNSDRHLFMFDTFETFPEEHLGVDRFWSETHPVDYDEVKAKFEDRGNATLVKGDFTSTLPTSGAATLALSFVDCDSYRATAWLLPELWKSHTPVGGLVVMEDYGHAALLGNRIAVHNFFDGHRDAAVDFSARSGLYTALKMS